MHGLHFYFLVKIEPILVSKFSTMKKYILLAIIFSITLTSWFIGHNQIKKYSKIQHTDIQEPFKDNKAIYPLLKNACYDCHSNTTRYPFYANFYPISTYIIGHVKHGRKEFNFSKWDGLNGAEKISWSKRVIKYVKSKNMPLRSYTILHREAILSDQDQHILINSFKEEINRQRKALVQQRLSGHFIHIDAINGDTTLYFTAEQHGFNKRLLLENSWLLYVQDVKEKGKKGQRLFLKEHENGPGFEITAMASIIYHEKMIKDTPGILYCRKLKNTYELVYKDLESFEDIPLFSNRDSILQFDINPIDSTYLN